MPQYRCRASIVNIGGIHFYSRCVPCHPSSTIGEAARLAQVWGLPSLQKRSAKLRFKRKLWKAFATSWQKPSNAPWHERVTHGGTDTPSCLAWLPRRPWLEGHALQTHNSNNSGKNSSNINLNNSNNHGRNSSNKSSNINLNDSNSNNNNGKNSSHNST